MDVLPDFVAGLFARAMLIRKAAIAALNSEAISVIQNFVAGLFRLRDAYQKGRYWRLKLRGDFATFGV